MFEVLTRVAVEVGLTGTLASNRVPGRVVRSNQRRRACAQSQRSAKRLKGRYPTVRSEVDGAVSNTAAGVVGDAHRKVVPINK